MYRIMYLHGTVRRSKEYKAKTRMYSGRIARNELESPPTHLSKC